MRRTAPIRPGPAVEGLIAPRGRPLIVNVVINVETWAYDRPMPRRILGAPHGVATVPDVPNYSWVAYGVRRGLPRLTAALLSRGLPASVAYNAAVTEDYPDIPSQLIEAGFEFVGHGIEQESAHGVSDEAKMVADTLSEIERIAGKRPRGWLGPGLQETYETLNILSLAGIDYVLDWIIDDVPVWLETEQARVLAIPYSLELNDSVLFAAHEYATTEYLERLVATLAVLERELDRGPRVLSLPLHPHLLGVPHRIASFERALDILMTRDDTVFLTSSEVFDWYVQAESKPK